MYSQEQVRDELKTFLARRIPEDILDDDLNTFESGYINSMFAMEIVMHIEEILGFRIPANRLDMKSFRTLGSITQLVCSLRDEAGNLEGEER